MLSQILMLIVFYHIRCNSSLCSNGRLEDFPTALKEFQNNTWLVWLSIFLVILVALYNSIGVSLTKYASATLRCISGQLRIVVVWVFFLLTPSSAQESFSFVQLFGFIVLVSGTLIYNEIIFNQ